MFYGHRTGALPSIARAPDGYTIVFEVSNFVLPAKFRISLFYISLGDLSEYASQRNHTFENLIFRSGQILFHPAKSKNRNIKAW